MMFRWMITSFLNEVTHPSVFGDKFLFLCDNVSLAPLVDILQRFCEVFSQEKNRKSARKKIANNVAKYSTKRGPQKITHQR